MTRLETESGSSTCTPNTLPWATPFWGIWIRHSDSSSRAEHLPQAGSAGLMLLHLDPDTIHCVIIQHGATELLAHWPLR